MERSMSILWQAVRTFRYRRNIDCLSNNQLHDLREALQAMYELPPEGEHGFAKIAGLHWVPGRYCKHGYPGFLTWHRAYMEVFENALRCIKSNVTLPFWDWSSGPTTGVPGACSQPTYVNRSGDTVQNPLYSGPLPDNTKTSRNSDIANTAFDAAATQAQSALGSEPFSTFQMMLNSPHGLAHVLVGGDMGSASYAAYDPIFYLHHCNVDRLWAVWQKSHPESLSTNEADLELVPFNKPYSTEMRTGSEFATTDMLGYRYSSCCIHFPGLELFKTMMRLELNLAWACTWMKTARLVLKTARMSAQSMEIRVFINEPRASEKTPTLGNPKFAGAFGVFGMSDGRGDMERRKIKNERFDMELDISKALKELSNGAEELTLRLVPVGLDGKIIPSGEVNVDEVELLAD